MTEQEAHIEVFRPVSTGTGWLVMFRAVCNCAWVGPTSPRLQYVQDSFMAHWERGHATP